MKEFSDFIGKRILFNQISVWKRYHELKADDERIGTLKQRGFFGLSWEASFYDKKWEIYRESIWKSKVEIRELGFELPYASFITKFFKRNGTVELPKGEKIYITPHLFRGSCVITDDQNYTLASIKPKAALRDKAEVILESKSVAINKYPWLVMLAYIVLNEQRNRAIRAVN